MPDKRENEERSRPQRLCPKCQSPRVFRSHRRSGWESWQSWRGKYPFRCHACSHRFTAGAENGGGVTDPRTDQRKRRTRRMVRQGVLVTVCVAAFVAFLYYLAQPGHFGGDAP